MPPSCANISKRLHADPSMCMRLFSELAVELTRASRGAPKVALTKFNLTLYCLYDVLIGLCTFFARSISQKTFIQKFHQCRLQCTHSDCWLVASKCWVPSLSGGILGHVDSLKRSRAIEVWRSIGHKVPCGSGANILAINHFLGVIS